MIVTKYRCTICDENLFKFEIGESYFETKSCETDTEKEIFSIDYEEQTVVCISCNIHYLPCEVCSKFCRLVSIHEDNELLTNFEHKNVYHVPYEESIVGPDGGNTLKWECDTCKRNYETCDK